VENSLSISEKERLLQNPLVMDIEENYERITVFIDSCDCLGLHSKKLRFKIPRCRLLLRKDGISPLIRLYYLNKDKGIQALWGQPIETSLFLGHPHVFGTGRPCLGNVKKTFYSWLKGKEYAAAINLIIQFLQVCNTE
jgi:hypothetical protein